MGGLVLAGNTSGSTTIQATDAVTATITLPSATSTLVGKTTPSFTTTIGVGNATPSASGAGITFPATQSASTDANTLDDYEEGTWTPTLNFSGGAGSLSYATRNGTYTKIGRVVYLAMDIVFSKGTASGTLDTVSGIPFNASGMTFSSGAAIDNMNSLSGSPIWGVSGGTLYIYMTATGLLTVINASSMGASSNVIRFAGYYNIS